MGHAKSVSLMVTASQPCSGLPLAEASSEFHCGCLARLEVRESAVQWGTAFRVVQMHEFFEETQKGLLFFFAQRFQQAAVQHVP